jgi:hypothetical protein
MSGLSYAPRTWVQLSLAGRDKPSAVMRGTRLIPRCRDSSECRQGDVRLDSQLAADI